MENEQLTEIAIFIDGNNFYKGLEKSAAHFRFKRKRKLFCVVVAK